MLKGCGFQSSLWLQQLPRCSLSTLNTLVIRQWLCMSCYSALLWNWILSGKSLNARRMSQNQRGSSCTETTLGLKKNQCIPPPHALFGEWECFFAYRWESHRQDCSLSQRVILKVCKGLILVFMPIIKMATPEYHYEWLGWKATVSGVSEAQMDFEQIL